MRPILLVLPLVATLIGFNYHQLIRGAKVGITAMVTEDDLRVGFMPSPGMARLLAFGHPNTVARLRWLDTYRYTMAQFVRRDDRLADGSWRGGFHRIYGNLTALDPRFEPFYHHANLCLGGILPPDPQRNRKMLALQILGHGLGFLPDRTHLWMGVAACWYTDFSLEQTNPEAMNRFLAEWATAERHKGAESSAIPLAWMAAMSYRQALDLAQLPFWGERLLGVAPDSPQAGYLSELMRDQIAQFQLDRFRRLIDQFQAANARFPLSCEECLVPAHIARLPAIDDPLVQAALPFAWTGTAWRLRTDPWGFPFVWTSSPKPAVISPGQQRRKYQQAVESLNQWLQQAVKTQGRWPSTVAEALTLAGRPVPEPPEGLHLELADRQLVAVAPPPPQPAWTRTQLLATAGLAP